MRSTQAGPGERGAAAVEFALVLPVLLLVIFGIIDFGRMLNAQITLTEAAREGARATSILDAAAGGLRIDAVLNGMSPVTPNITACPITPGPSDDAVVTLTHEFSFVTPIGLLGGGTATLTGKGVMPCL
jgi:Flp pilus assembly protein TadG